MRSGTGEHPCCPAVVQVDARNHYAVVHDRLGSFRQIVVVADPPFFTGKDFFWADGSQRGRLAFADSALDEAAQTAFHLQWIGPYTRQQVPVSFAVFCDLQSESALRDAFRSLQVPLRSEVVLLERGAGPIRRAYREGYFFEHVKVLVFTHTPLAPPPESAAAAFLSDQDRSVWSSVNPRGTETGYPTEKSQAVLLPLLQWLVREQPAIVIDPFAGSGSTARAALKLGHASFSSDISADAIAYMLSNRGTL